MRVPCGLRIALRCGRTGHGSFERKNKVYALRLTSKLYSYTAIVYVSRLASLKQSLCVAY